MLSRRHGAASRLLFGLTIAVIGAVACADEPPTPDLEELDRLRTVGLALLEEGRLADAAASFSHLTELAPEEPLGPADLAVARLRQGDLEGARRAARKAVDRGPSDPGVRVIAAAVAAEAGDDDGAREHLFAALEADAMHVAALWDLHELTGAPAPLETLLRARPANLAALLTAAEVRLRTGALHASATALEGIAQLIDAGDTEARTPLHAALEAIARGESGLALRQIRSLHDKLRVAPSYTRDLAELTGRPDSRAEPLRRFRTVARPPKPAVVEGLGLRFERSSIVQTGRDRDADGPAWAAGTATDIDGDDDLDVVVSTTDGLRCLVSRGSGLYVQECVTRAPARAIPMQAADFDGDARADVLVAGASGVRILRADSAGFALESTLGTFAARIALAADFDHDGDLDVLAGGEGSARLYGQTAPGRFVERSAEAGLAGLSGLRAASFGDIDRDGDLDLVVATGKGLRRLDNQRHGVFVEAAGVLSAAGEEVGSGIPAIVDLNGDGWFDVLIASRSGLYVATGDGTGALEPPVPAVPGATRVGRPEAGASGGSDPRLIVEDLDLDGYLDALVQRGPTPPSLHAYRGTGTGRFVDSSGTLPETLRRAGGPVVALDLDGDGDLDLASGADGGVYLNRGGEANHALEVSLLAAAAGSVNRLGIGSRLDVWAGGRRQNRVVRGEVERFGLGSHEAADVVRIEWTNGVSRNVFDPSTRERLVETRAVEE